MNYNQALNFINKRERFGIKLGLKNIKELLKKLENPEKDLRVIHVAGTNGKGSTCAMISSILQSSGYKVGFYSSPHLKTIKERFRINDTLISCKDFTNLVKIIKPLVKEETYFEVTTTLAFIYFKQKKVDFTILEAGMGGRLDATNVIENPLLSVITNIDYEHCNYLGDTITEIAKEKAGIIKKDSIVLTGAKGEAYRIIKKIAIKKKSLLFKNKTYNYKTNLFGKFQESNMNLAVSAVNLLKKYYKIKINNKDIINGLKKVYWPGRFEFLKTNLLVDCAHNPNSIKVLVTEINRLLRYNINYNLLKINNNDYINNNFKKIILILGILDDKDYKTMIKELMKIRNIKRIIITKANSKRALNPLILAEEIKKYNKYFLIIDKVKRAFRYALNTATKDDLILVTGSIYVIGEVY
jgi:dihydrofolate synthase/folylpolyglutamate synthase